MSGARSWKWGIVLVGACRSPAAGRFMAGDSMLPSYAVGAALDVRESAPSRGLVVVFRSPEKPGHEFFKRVIGIPGDVVAMRDDEVIVNGVPIPRCRVGRWGYDEPDGKRRDGEIWVETSGAARWLVFHDAAGAYAPPSGPWTVAAGEVFVLGDNRENSFDSRMWPSGSGLRVSFIIGSTTSEPRLPKGAEALAPALDACLAR